MWLRPFSPSPLALSLLVSLAACEKGQNDAPADLSFGDSTEAGDMMEGEMGGPRATTLSLVAGGLGGSGNVDGTGPTARFNGPNAAVFDGVDTLYVSDTGNNTIRKVVLSTGEVMTVAGNASEVAGATDGTGADARFFAPAGLALDGSGNLYVADNFNNTIRKVNPATGEVVTLAGKADAPPSSADGTGVAARFYSPVGVVSNGEKTLYVTDGSNCTIRQIDTETGGVITLAGAVQACQAIDGTGTAAQFGSPRGLVYGTVGENIPVLYVADLIGVIRRVSLSDRNVTTLAITDETGQLATVSTPTGLALDGNGHLYVSESSRNRIQQIDLTSMEMTLLAGNSNPGGLDGTGEGARFDFPQQLAFAAGNLYVADANNDALRKIVVTAGVDLGTVTTPIGALTHRAANDGTGADAGFSFPSGGTSDGEGNVYVTDTGNNAIRKVVLATGEVTTIAGQAGVDTYGDEDSPTGPGSAARFSGPTGITFWKDPAGAEHLFVVDHGNNTIRQVDLAADPAAVRVMTLAGQARTLPDSMDGTGADARFARPQGVVSDGQGFLYVADTGSGEIRKVEIATAIVNTVLDEDAGIFAPYGIALDGQGNLYVSDNDEGVIQKVDLATRAVTLVAGAPDGSQYIDATGAAARFAFPTAMAYDGQGNLYVADGNNHAIRKVVIASGEVSTFAGRKGSIGVSLGDLPAGLNNPLGVVVISPTQIGIFDENAFLLAH
jgi:sugar lactone lactonase YvrE